MSAKHLDITPRTIYRWLKNGLMSAPFSLSVSTFPRRLVDKKSRRLGSASPFSDRNVQGGNMESPTSVACRRACPQNPAIIPNANRSTGRRQDGTPFALFPWERCNRKLPPPSGGAVERGERMDTIRMRCWFQPAAISRKSSWEEEPTVDRPAHLPRGPIDRYAML